MPTATPDMALPERPDYGDMPTVEQLVASAQNLPLLDAMFWTDDALDRYQGTKIYQIFKQAHNKRELRDLWPAQLFIKWDALKHDTAAVSAEISQEFWRRSSRAIATLAQGDVIVVSAPKDTTESGEYWSANDRYWEDQEFPILKRRLGEPNGVKTLSRVNIDKQGRFAQWQKLRPVLEDPQRDPTTFPY